LPTRDWSLADGTHQLAADHAAAIGIEEGLEVHGQRHAEIVLDLGPGIRRSSTGRRLAEDFY
jgi:hypothetical protein